MKLKEREPFIEASCEPWEDGADWPSPVRRAVLQELLTHPRLTAAERERVAALLRAEPEPP